MRYANNHGNQECRSERNHQATIVNLLFAFLITLSFSFIGQGTYAGLRESIQSGKWNNSATWEGGVIPFNNDSVIVRAAHEVELSDHVNCSSLTVEGTLDMGLYSINLNGTNLKGRFFTLVDNNSVLRIGGTQGFPSNFLYMYVGSHSTVEYYGNDQPVSALSNGQSYADLILSGNGTKTLLGSINVNQKLTIKGMALLKIESNTLAINGSPIQDSPNNLVTTPNSSLIFNGAIPGMFIPASVTELNNLTVNNSYGLTLKANLKIYGMLSLSKGPLNTDNYKLHVVNTNLFAINNVAGYVVGELTRNTNSNGTYYFYLGDPGSVYRYRPVGIAPDVAAPQTFSVRFINHDPSLDGYDHEKTDGKPGMINPSYYYTIKRSKGYGTATLSLVYISAQDYLIDTTGLRIVMWGKPLVAQWNTIGGNASANEIKAENVSEFDSPFTIAGNFNPLTGLTEIPDGNEKFYVYPAYPNPASVYSNLRVYAPHNTVITVEVHDIYGRRVHVRSAKIQSGESEMLLDVSRLAKGMYNYAVKSDQENFNGKLLVIR